MTSEFFFSVARITCAQIFRAAGIDRCSPSLLDVITDLFIRYLDLLAITASKNASLSGRNEVVIQDVSMAMEETGLIKPFALLDPEDISPQGIEGFELFINWAKGPVPEEARRVSGYVNTKKVRENEDKEADQIEADGQTQSQAQMQLIDEDGGWLTALVKKRTRIDHEHKLKHTLLAKESVDQTPVFTQVIGGPPELNLLSPEMEVEEVERMKANVNENEGKNAEKTGQNLVEDSHHTDKTATEKTQSESLEGQTIPDEQVEHKQQSQFEETVAQTPF